MVRLKLQNYSFGRLLFVLETTGLHYASGVREIGVRLPSGSQIFPPPHALGSIHRCWDKAARAWAYRSPAPSDEAENVWNYNCVPQTPPPTPIEDKVLNQAQEQKEYLWRQVDRQWIYRKKRQKHKMCWTLQTFSVKRNRWAYWN
jgi:hypothetical protein